MPRVEFSLKNPQSILISILKVRCALLILVSTMGHVKRGMTASHALAPAAILASGVRKKLKVMSCCNVCTLHIRGFKFFYFPGSLCAIQPCVNNGTCREKNGDITCTCASGYTGKRCGVKIEGKSAGILIAASL